MAALSAKAADNSSREMAGPATGDHEHTAPGPPLLMIGDCDHRPFSRYPEDKLFDQVYRASKRSGLLAMLDTDSQFSTSRN